MRTKFPGRPQALEMQYQELTNSHGFTTDDCDRDAVFYFLERAFAGLGLRYRGVRKAVASSRLQVAGFKFSWEILVFIPACMGGQTVSKVGQIVSDLQKISRKFAPSSAAQLRSPLGKGSKP